MCIKTVHSKRFTLQLQVYKYFIYSDPKKTTAEALIIEETNYFTNPKQLLLQHLKKEETKMTDPKEEKLY